MPEGKMMLEETRRASPGRLDIKDRELLNLLQAAFPLAERPFHQLALKVGIGEEELIKQVKRLKEQGLIREIGAIFDARRIGYQSTLVALRLPSSQLDKAAEIISRHPGVSHNYSRNHDYNLWFTLTIPKSHSLKETVEILTAPAGAQNVLLLPALRVFKIRVHFNLLTSSRRASSPLQQNGFKEQTSEEEPLSDLGKRAIYQLQQDLPLLSHPFQVMADRLYLKREEFLALAKDFLRRGIMRRYGALLYHRKVGFMANAMSCWNVPVPQVGEVGRKMASFSAVSHCYQRLTCPEWCYNIFTMIHGHRQDECESIAREISRETGVKEYISLYSVREYKKEKVKYFPEYC